MPSARVTYRRKHSFHTASNKTKKYTFFSPFFNSVSLGFPINESFPFSLIDCIDCCVVVLFLYTFPYFLCLGSVLLVAVSPSTTSRSLSMVLTVLNVAVFSMAYDLFYCALFTLSFSLHSVFLILCSLSLHYILIVCLAQAHPCYSSPFS